MESWETWLSYSPRDFLLFSEQVYWRLFELNNDAMWPVHLAVLAGFSAFLVILRYRPTHAGHAAAVLLALAWASVALGFLPRYAAINWVAGDLVAVFLFQAGLLLVLGLKWDLLHPGRPGVRRRIGLGLVVHGTLLHPLVSVFAGRPFTGGELLALAPDPTAIVTLGAILIAGSRWAVPLLLPIPLFWCLVSGATLATLGAWQAAIPLLAVLTAVGASILRPDAAGRRRNP